MTCWCSGCCADDNDDNYGDDVDDVDDDDDDDESCCYLFNRTVQYKSVKHKKFVYSFKFFHDWGWLDFTGAQGRCSTRARGWQGETSQGETGSITLQGWRGENLGEFYCIPYLHRNAWEVSLNQKFWVAVSLFMLAGLRWPSLMMACSYVLLEWFCLCAPFRLREGSSNSKVTVNYTLKNHEKSNNKEKQTFSKNGHQKAGKKTENKQILRKTRQPRVFACLFLVCLFSVVVLRLFLFVFLFAFVLFLFVAILPSFYFLCVLLLIGIQYDDF